MRFGTMNFTKVMAMAAGLTIMLMPVTASAAEADVDAEVVIDVQVAENESANENDDAVVETSEVTIENVANTDSDEQAQESENDVVDAADDFETTEVAENVVDTETTDVVTDSTSADDNSENDNTVDVVEANVVEDVNVDEAETAVETADETEESAPVFDQKAVKWLKTAAKCNEQLSDNSFSTGLAAFNQVSRCRELATKLLTFKYNYMDGMMVIGHSYDMNLGDNNYIMVEMKDTKTGEIIDKYFDFYMQDSNGNNVTNMFKYHTVDRIVIVEKGELTGEKKLGMYVHPTFASKSNGNVVFDIDSYSKLISDEYISYVENSVN